MAELGRARPVVVAAIAVILTANFSLLATDYSEARPETRLTPTTVTIAPTGFVVFGSTDTRVGRPTVFAVRADGTGLKPSTLPPVRLDPPGPAWSHDGNTRVVVRERDGSDNLWAIRRTTGEATQLTDFDSAQLKRPVWSPDDRHVAFLFRKGATYDIRVVGADGTPVGVAYDTPSGRDDIEYVSLFGWAADNMAG